MKINNPLRLLMIGKYYERKKHHLLIEALITIKKKYDFHLTVVGEVSNAKHKNNLLRIKNQISNGGIDDKVDFLNNIPFNRMKSIYASHDLFILPASNEPASISLLEAMGYGLPAICSDTCGTKTYIKNNYNGSIFKTNNVSSLIEKICNYFENKEFLLNQKKWILNNIKKDISPQNYIYRFNEILNIENVKEKSYFPY